MSDPKHRFLHDLFLKHAHEITDLVGMRWPLEPDAADIVQEPFLCLSSQYPNLETIQNPRALLFKTASNAAVDRQRYRKTRRRDTEDTAPVNFAETPHHHSLTTAESGALPENVVKRIFLDTSPQLHRFLARRVQCPETAADLTQEIYLRLPQMQTSVVSEVGVRAWLFRVASNLSIDHLRSQRRHSELLNRFCGNETEIDQAPSPYRAVMDHDRLKRVQNALKELPDQCADVLYLSRIEGYSHAEIAGQLGISKSLVEKHIARALNHCRQVIDEE